MYENIKSTLKELTIDQLNCLNVKNDLRIDFNDLVIFHQLLSEQWHDVIDESSLSLNNEHLGKHFNSCNVSKYNELITSIKRNVILNKNNHLQ